MTVAVESATIGAITDIDGAFTIQVPAGKVVLNVSYIGFASQKVTVAPDQSSVTVHMSEDAVMLNETVVVGYGKQKKVNLTGAVATVGGDELNTRDDFAQQYAARYGGWFERNHFFGAYREARLLSMCVV